MTFEQAERLVEVAKQLAVVIGDHDYLVERSKKLGEHSVDGLAIHEAARHRDDLRSELRDLAVEVLGPCQGWQESR